MNTKMAPLEIIGLKTDLQLALHTLRGLGCVHIDEMAESSNVLVRPLNPDRDTLKYQEDLSLLAARVDGLIEILGCGSNQASPPASEDCIAEARSAVEEILPQVQALTSRRDAFQAELASLPRYETTLRRLLPIIPESAHKPGNVSVGVLGNREHLGVLDLLSRQVLELTNGRAETVSSDVDASTRAMLIVFPQEFTDKIESILGHEDISRLRLPAQLGGGPPDIVLDTLQRRMAIVPEEIKSVERELTQFSLQWCDRLAAWSARLHEEIDTNSVLTRFGETDMTFAITGWTPASDFERVKAGLQAAVGDTIHVRLLPFTPEMKKRAPVVLQNPSVAKPFESLVNLLALPRYGHIDPTRLMAFFMPIFFGMILGDIGYGAILLALSLILTRKFKKGVLHDILVVLAMGSVWGIIFGFLFGEAFGTLGEEWGLHPLWFARTDASMVLNLLADHGGGRRGSRHARFDPRRLGGASRAQPQPSAGTRRDAGRFDQSLLPGRRAGRPPSRRINDPGGRRIDRGHCHAGRLHGLAGFVDGAHRIHRVDRQRAFLSAYCGNRAGVGVSCQSRQRIGWHCRQPDRGRHHRAVDSRLEPGDGRVQPHDPQPAFALCRILSQIL
ncbi:MAG: hypothetical protein HND47_16430 [Chloroflexi bacterium]|nr:hypothetical protein [Chloroflexota bacterium]